MLIGNKLKEACMNEYVVLAAVLLLYYYQTCISVVCYVPIASDNDP